MQEPCWRLRYNLDSRGFAEPLLVGKGAFCPVYRVREKATGRWYACKVGMGSHKAHVRREKEFLQELRHPLFPRYQRHWEEEDFYCLVMEYVPGSNLEDLLNRRKRFSGRQTLETAAEIAEGLSYLHRRGIIFRDVKARNILIRQDGRVKLLDFGCACLQNEECSIKAGTPGFAAPKQLTEGRVDFSSDIYALGRVMQYMLSGENPCLATEDRLREAWRGAKCERRARRMVEKCIGKNPEERLTDMYTLLYILKYLNSSGRRKYFEKRAFKVRLEFSQSKSIWKSSNENYGPDRASECGNK